MTDRRTVLEAVRRAERTGRPLLLDLFCCGGGAGMGYRRAGFEVLGVDVAPQPRYPFAFVQMDAFRFLSCYSSAFAAFHGSPPCQRYTKLVRELHKRPNEHPDLVEPTRDALQRTARPYVIENVPGAPMAGAVTLCGSMFGLKVRRHRLFELSGFGVSPPPCNHATQGKVVRVYGNSGGSARRCGTKHGGADDWREAMGISWLGIAELREAIPPAYTEFIGRALRDTL